MRLADGRGHHPLTGWREPGAPSDPGGDVAVGGGVGDVDEGFGESAEVRGGMGVDEAGEDGGTVEVDRNDRAVGSRCIADRNDASAARP